MAELVFCASSAIRPILDRFRGVALMLATLIFIFLDPSILERNEWLKVTLPAGIPDNWSIYAKILVRVAYGRRHRR